MHRVKKTAEEGIPGREIRSSAVLNVHNVKSRDQSMLRTAPVFAEVTSFA